MAFHPYAGFWRRLVAFTIDGTIICFIFIFLFFIASMAFFSGAVSANGEKFLASLGNAESLSPAMISLWLFYILLNIGYFTYFHGATGRTPGKSLLGMQVVSTEGTPISFGTAFLRSVGYLVSNILYLGFIWVAFDRRKQGWHDKIAGTVVIRRESYEQSAGVSIAEPTWSPPKAQQTKQPETNEN